MIPLQDDHITSEEQADLSLVTQNDKNLSHGHDPFLQNKLEAQTGHSSLHSVLGLTTALRKPLSAFPPVCSHVSSAPTCPHGLHKQRQALTCFIYTPDSPYDSLPLCLGQGTQIISKLFVYSDNIYQEKHCLFAYK